MIREYGALLEATPLPDSLRGSEHQKLTISGTWDYLYLYSFFFSFYFILEYSCFTMLC